MKYDFKKKLTYALILSLVMGLMLFAMTACSSKEEEEIVDEDGYLAYVVFDSDSDNGIAWECTLSNEIFEVEDSFLEDESYEGEGSGEEQDFFLYPVVAGTTDATFTCTDANGVDYEYVYTLTVDDDLRITVDNAAGTAGGEPVEAPEMIVDAVG